MRSTRIAPGERRLLLGCLVLYAAMGASSVLSSLLWNPLPGVAEYGPIVVSIGASHLVASRQRRLERGLAELVDQKTAALRESEERCRDLIESAPIAVVSCDLAGNVQTANRRLFEMIGAPHASLLRSFNLMEDEGTRASGTPALLRQALASGETCTGDGRYVSEYGRLIDVNIVVAPQRDAQGALSGALILVDDVTEQRALEQRLRHSQKMESIGRLAAGIAQEIDGPMAEARADLAELREQCAALHKEIAPPVKSALAQRFGEMEQLVDESLEGVERTIAIVRDMREFWRAGAAEISSCDVNALVQSAVRIASTQRREQVELVERYGSVPLVAAVAGQLRQVFLNLIVNALQAVGERGSVTISTEPDDVGVAIRVSDDGPGIAAADRERLFEPFFTTKQAGEGTGLGLFISYQIMRRHAGEIRVESELGVGTSFEVWLPAAPAESAA
jgi:PAS domain S-box-containing protein